MIIGQRLNVDLSNSNTYNYRYCGNCRYT